MAPYIYGYEFENQSTQTINLDKARDTETETITTVKPFDLGSYVSMKFVENLPAGIGQIDGSGIEKPVTLNVLDSTDAVVGTVEPISVQKERSDLDLDTTAGVDTDFYRFYFKSVTGTAFEKFKHPTVFL